MKIVCILFNIGKDKGKLSEDSKIRLSAGAELAKEDDKALVFFIGGHGLKISGAEMMGDYWKENFSEVENEYFTLDYSNNTFGNLEEIKDFLKKRNISYLKMEVISNKYHTKRLQEIINEIGLGATVLSAEDILISKNIKVEELKKYLNSLAYKRKIFLEKVMRFYLMLDPKQKIIKFWRRFSYGG